MARTLILGLAAVALLGCEPGGGVSPGEPDAGEPGDVGGPGLAGLTLEFRIKPEVPGTVVHSEPEHQTESHLADAWLGLADVSAIGDAAPGDERTLAESVELDGLQSDRVEVPFVHAPPGIYSQVLLDVTTYRLSGTSVLDGTTVDFEIDDTPPGGLRVPVSVSDLSLAAGDSERVRIDVRLDKVLDELELYEMAPSSDCPNSRPCYRLTESSSRIGELREELGKAFRFHE